MGFNLGFDGLSHWVDVMTAFYCTAVSETIGDEWVDLNRNVLSVVDVDCLL